MHSFCQLVHKQTTDYETNKEYSNKPLINILLQIFLLNPIHYSIKAKFDFFKTVLDNQFINMETKRDFITVFSTIQKNYWLLNRFVHNFKLKKAPFLIRNDLILTPISESSHNVITILQNNNKYLFTVNDLRNIIEVALSNSPYMFANPSPPKNPYTNMPFSKSILYQIYFFMKHGNFLLSNLFHNYFLCNFNLTTFKCENEFIIRKKYIQQYLKNMDNDDLYYYSICMLSTTKYTRRMKINKGFPKKLFIDIMMPYLKIYVNYLYSLDVCERKSMACLLNMHLKKFYKFNPKFGRKYVRHINGKAIDVSYDTSHVNFSGMEYSTDYKKSHLELDENIYGNDFSLYDGNVNHNRNGVSYYANEEESLSGESSGSEDTV